MKISSKIILTAFGLSILFPRPLLAESPDDFFKRIESEYDSFKTQANESYNSFRDKVNKQYADFMEKPWKAVETVKPLAPPAVPEPGPTKVPEDKDPLADPPAPVTIIETVTTPAPAPQPQPVEPIAPAPVVPGIEPIRMEVYGTKIEIPGTDFSSFRLRPGDTSSLAQGWRILSQRQTNNLINGCLKVRDELALPDWHYMMLLDAVADYLSDGRENEKTMITAYLLNQSGYDIRMAYERNSGRLHLLFNSSGILYRRARYKMDNRWYYALELPKEPVVVCDFATPGETPLSMAIAKVPKLDFKPGNTRTINVHNHPDLVLTMTTNQNLIDLLGDYPEAGLTPSENSQWSPHATMPVSDEIRREIYPVLREAVKGLSQYEAVDLLLRVAQSFPYEYDDEVWGKDRVFFMDESWHYPYSACEDPAINLSHLIHDILGLPTCLVSYPGHLSMGVAINDGSAKGDYVAYKGRNYTMCDATYFYAPAGSTASSYNNSSAVLIPVN